MTVTVRTPAKMIDVRVNLMLKITPASLANYQKLTPKKRQDLNTRYWKDLFGADAAKVRNVITLGSKTGPLNPSGRKWRRSMRSDPSANGRRLPNKTILKIAQEALDQLSGIRKSNLSYGTGADAWFKVADQHASIHGAAAVEDTGDGATPMSQVSDPPYHCVTWYYLEDGTKVARYNYLVAVDDGTGETTVAKLQNGSSPIEGELHVEVEYATA
jgi:hypothetical protein